MLLSLPDIFTGNQHHFQPEVDLVTRIGNEASVYDVMLTAIPQGSSRREVVGTVGQVNFATGEMRLLQPSVPEDRLPVIGSIRPDAQDRLDDIRAWLGAAVQAKVAESGYSPLGDFFSAQE